MVIFFSILAFFATILGGGFALKYKDKLHLILGFSAGAVLGVAFFDLLPEAYDLAGARYNIPALIMFGFVGFMLIDRLFAIHAHDDHCENINHKGRLGALTLSIHSLLDGIAIGLSFKVSAAVGLAVTLGVIAHDFSDGINTVGLIIKNQGSRKQAFRYLVLDALAPIIGVIFTLFFTIEKESLGFILALFCGLFIFIGAADLLPESHHEHSTMLTTVMTVIGITVLFLAMQLSKI